MSSGSYKPFYPAGWRPWDAQPPATGTVAGAVAATVATDRGFADWGNGADFRHFQRSRERGVATVAAVATPRLPWGDGLAQLGRLPCPTWLSQEQWDRLVFEALALSRDWGEQAHALGWGTLELFGCHPEPWKARLDRDGLVLTLADWRGPMRVRAMTTDAIVLEVDQGHTLRRTRHDRSGAVPIWTGYAQEGGP